MKITKCIIVVLLTTLVNPALYAQEKQEWEKSVKPTEIKVGTVKEYVSGGSITWYSFRETDDRLVRYTKEELYEELLKKAKEEYSEKYHNFLLRDFKSEYKTSEFGEKYKNDFFNGYTASYHVSATVVVPDYQKQITEGFSKAMDKGFRNVREGSRIAIDVVTVASGIDMDKSTVKDMIVDVLLDKDYKVVAKEYLEKLLKEQQEQQSGIYNDNTTVRDNNFSAVGYYINVKVTETSLRLQVINVSTGEYEGNVTVNL